MGEPAGLNLGPKVQTFTQTAPCGKSESGWKAAKPLQYSTEEASMKTEKFRIIQKHKLFTDFLQCIIFIP